MNMGASMEEKSIKAGHAPRHPKHSPKTPHCPWIPSRHSLRLRPQRGQVPITFTILAICLLAFAFAVTGAVSVTVIFFVIVFIAPIIWSPPPPPSNRSWNPLLIFRKRAPHRLVSDRTSMKPHERDGRQTYWWTQRLDDLKRREASRNSHSNIVKGPAFVIFCSLTCNRRAERA